MPIYEFYCADCHTLFNFLSQRVDTQTRPPCPCCDRPRLERRPARFATLRHAGQDESDPFAGLDEERLGGVMESLADEFGDLGDEQDPARLAAVFRRFGEAAGLEMGPRLEELMRRLEAGEDPDSLEQEMEDDLDDDAALAEFFRLKKRGGRAAPPRVDETLYFL